MSTDTVTATIEPATAMPSILATALAEIDRQRAELVALEADCRWALELIARHPAVSAYATVYHGMSVYIGITCQPARLDDMAPLLREIRERTGKPVEVRQLPDQSRICYGIGSWHVSAWLSKQCTFRQVGTKTVEQPVYEIQCGDAPAAAL